MTDTGKSSGGDAGEADPARASQAAWDNELAELATELDQSIDLIEGCHYVGLLTSGGWTDVRDELLVAELADRVVAPLREEHVLALASGGTVVAVPVGLPIGTPVAAV